MLDLAAKPLGNETCYAVGASLMFKILQSLQTLSGVWLCVTRLVAETRAVLDFKNTPPPGLLRGHRMIAQIATVGQDSLWLLVSMLKLYK